LVISKQKILFFRYQFGLGRNCQHSGLTQRFNREIRKKQDDIVKEKIEEIQIEINQRTKEFKIELENVRLDEKNKYSNDLRKRVTKAEKEFLKKYKQIQNCFSSSNGEKFFQMKALNRQLNEVTSKLRKYEE
jgi:hypothetical protein